MKDQSCANLVVEFKRLNKRVFELEVYKLLKEREEREGSDKKEVECSFGNRCDKCRTIMTTTHKKDIDVFMENKERLDKAISNKRNKELERLTDEMFKGSDKKDGCGKELFEHPDDPSLKACCGDTMNYFCDWCKDTHKKDYLNLKNGSKIMIGKSKEPLKGFSTDILLSNKEEDDYLCDCCHMKPKLDEEELCVDCK